MAAAKTKKVIVKFHDGTSVETEVQDFSAQDIENKLNDSSRDSICIGEVIAHRSTVAGIVPVKE